MRSCLGVVLGLIACASASAAPLRPTEVPAALQPWIDWALHGREEARCPFLGAPEARECAWPSRLTLVLDDRGGRFTQQWLVQRASTVALPGDEAHWPQQVRAGDRPAVVTLRDGVPVVRLEPGTHAIAGTFEWEGLPELLPTPPATGLVALTVGAEVVAFPKRDAEGRLWLRQRAAEADAEARLDFVAVRLLRDDVPAVLTTQLELKVSGKSREAVLASVLPPGFAPLALASPLPARLDPDQRLRIQLRPGAWTLTITGRHEGPATAIAFQKPDGPWVSEEVWAFEAVPALRQVTIEGVETIDPSQTMLPAAWRRFPAYRLRPGDTMKLVETRRGDADAAPDQLALERIWWLDFDGGGYTVHDRVSGTMATEWRLEMEAPFALGRAAVGGVDQPITRLASDGPAGIEVRERSLEVEADARLDGGLRRVPVVGWQHDFTSVSGILNLPPGWRLFHARGVDTASPTWVGSWSTLDLFVVLVIALATLRLYGRGWGAVALVTLGLTYLEPGAPRWSWLAVLGADALVRVLPAGRMLRVMQATRLGLLVVLVGLGGRFVFREARLALYPALETPAMARVVGGAGGVATSAEEESGVREGADRLAKRAYRRDVPASVATEMKSMVQRYELDPSMRVQTGPGKPGWAWNRVMLQWQGPVERTQALGLMLVPPWANRLLGVGRVALVVALVLCLLGRVHMGVRGAAALVVLVLGVLSAAPAHADFPSESLLDRLRDRLLEPPACLPVCVGINRLALEANGDRLRMRLEVDAGVDTGVALPGSAQDWTPATVLVDERPASGLLRATDGRLWLALPSGRHEVRLEGALPPRDVVSIPLPERPRRVAATLSGWTIAGVREDGLPADTLQLVRAQSDARGGGELEPGTLPPFVRVTRRMRLGLTWEVDTAVERLSPIGTAIVLEVPLVDGEAVTSGGVRATGGKVAVSLAPQVTQASWHSVLDQRAVIRLVAPAGVAWVEAWSLDAGPIWHVEVEGIPIVQPGADDARTREWRPWPGETVTATISRPSAIPGPTLTIDQTGVGVRPGLRSSDVELSLTVRSSQGGRHRIGLPAGAVLQSVSVNGQPQPIRQEGDAVTLPIAPGTQQFQLAWRDADRGMTIRFASPLVDVGVPSVNATTKIVVPSSRWILAVGGPRLGPAVLFWSTLAVIALAALGLGRVSLVPLGAVQWFLLGVGLSQVNVWAALVVVGWFLALGWRRQRSDIGDRWFDLRQVVLVGWTLAMLAVLVAAIEQGLLGSPDMQIAGNGSTASELGWFQDRSGPMLPQAWVLSVPLMAYRAAMLAWAVWISIALVGRWLAWGWGSFGAGGLWRPLRRRTVTT